jgi:hypothetical protein
MIQNPEFCEDSPSQSYHGATSAVPAAMTLAAMQLRREDSQFSQQQASSETDKLSALPFVARSLPKRRPDDRIPAFMPRVALSTPLPLSRDVEDRITSLGPVCLSSYQPSLLFVSRADNVLHFLPQYWDEKGAILLLSCPGGFIIQSEDTACLYRRYPWSRRHCCGWG